MREAKELLVASKEYAAEVRWLSWWHLISTFSLFAGLIIVVCLPIAWPLRLLASVIAGLVFVRMFVIYHDHQHRAILRDSKFAAAIMQIYGVLAINPPSIWKRSHDHHHRNNSKTFGANIGSFPIMTTDAYDKATRRERLAYAASRHPLNIACGYVTIFLVGMCLCSFLASPKRHKDSAVALIIHALLVITLAVVAWDVLLLAVIVPYTIASAIGSYLFYAQHNFPDTSICNRADWNYVSAALNSSSFMKMNRLMHWFTGNIGYHHVHHLNSKIPFYRLPEAMAGIAELQSPRTTSLHPRDIVRCLRLKLWDNAQGRLVPFGESASNSAARPTSTAATKAA